MRIPGVLILTALLGCGCRGSIETDAGADANADDGATQDSGTDAADFIQSARGFGYSFSQPDEASGPAPG